MTRTLLGLVSPFRLWPSILSGVVGILLVGERVLGGRPKKQMYPDILTFIQPKTLVCSSIKVNALLKNQMYPNILTFISHKLVLQFYQSIISLQMIIKINSMFYLVPHTSSPLSIGWIWYRGSQHQTLWPFSL